MNHIKHHRMLLAMLLAALLADAAVTEVHDDSIAAGDSVVWSTGDTLLLMETVFIDSGAALYIEPGVVVRAVETPAQGTAVCLVVARHGRIWAEGTAEQPIIFTAENEDLTNPTMSEDEYGLWGGVAILGNAVMNRSTTGGTGVFAPASATDPRAAYGGDDDMDCSGRIAYVSIRFAGAADYESEDNEDRFDDQFQPAAIAFCAVGSGTEVHHVEAYNGLDDGFRFRGGTVNTSYLVAMGCMDNAFDTDEGYRGHGQFWFGTHRTDMLRTGDEIALHHGGIYDYTQPPFSLPVIANATYVTDGLIRFVEFDRNSGGLYLNSVFYHGGGVNVLPTAFGALDSGLIDIRNSAFGKAVGPGTTLEWLDFAIGQNIQDMLKNGDNEIVEPEFVDFVGSYLRTPRERIDLRTGADGTNWGTLWLAEVADTSFLKQACYRGAFDPTQPFWPLGWTATDYYGFLNQEGSAPLTELLPCNPDSCDTCCGCGTECPSGATCCIDTCPTGVQSSPQARGALKPGVVVAGDHLVASYTVNVPGHVRVVLYDLVGRPAVVLAEGFMDKGHYRRSVALKNLASGSYVCRMSTPGRTQSYQVPVWR
ncbi:MAG: hypothetical protein GF331_01350 [Chitinivibrionales bacterium]|nr:hypothetical protein [Chitinivibrionales bacterium]